jgi:hypothetical protein
MVTFRWPTPSNASTNQRSAAVAKRRLHDTLPIDRARATTCHDDSEVLLSHLLQEEPRPEERRSA